MLAVILRINMGVRMSRLVLAGLTLCAILLRGGGHLDGTPIPNRWSEILDCVEKQPDECKKKITQLAGQEPTTDEVKLARVLVEHWPSTEGAGTLAPRPVRLSLPGVDQARRLLPDEFEPIYILLAAEVTRTGQVRRIHLLKESPYDCLNQLVVETFEASLYVPAWSDGEFIAHQVQYLYRLEPR